MNTRFCVVPYHDLHIGHLHIILENWRCAHKSGGKFVLALYDSPCHFMPRGIASAPVSTMQDRYVEDLDWFGIAPDEIVWSSRNAEAHWQANQTLHVPRDTGSVWSVYNAHPPGVPWHTYHPWQTLAVVVDDHEAEIGGFCRGTDLLPQTQLYDYFCHQLGWNPPRQQYLPTICHEDAESKISKRDCGETLRDLRGAGYTARDITQSIAEMMRIYGMAGSTAHSLVIPSGYLTSREVRPLPHDPYWHAKLKVVEGSAEAEQLNIRAAIMASRMSRSVT